jgi:hypothetical protein
MIRTLVILIFDDVEVLDFCGPLEVFSVANHFTAPPRLMAGGGAALLSCITQPHASCFCKCAWISLPHFGHVFVGKAGFLAIGVSMKVACWGMYGVPKALTTGIASAS